MKKNGKNGSHFVENHYTAKFPITDTPKIWVSTFPSVDGNENWRFIIFWHFDSKLLYVFGKALNFDFENHGNQQIGPCSELLSMVVGTQHQCLSAKRSPHSKFDPCSKARQMHRYSDPML